MGGDRPPTAPQAHSPRIPHAMVRPGIADPLRPSLPLLSLSLTHTHTHSLSYAQRVLLSRDHVSEGIDGGGWEGWGRVGEPSGVISLKNLRTEEHSPKGYEKGGEKGGG